MQKFISNSPVETEKIAEQFSKSLKGGEVIAFTGDLGVGKTCFVRGIVRSLGCRQTVTSPTFALMNEYSGGRLPVFHFDMYRINSWEDLYFTGYFDYVEAGGVVAVEWSENIASVLDENTIFIDFARTGENSRTITIRRNND